MLLPLGDVLMHILLRRPRPSPLVPYTTLFRSPYSRGRLSPAKSEDRKGGEGKTDANLTHFFKHLLRLAPQLAATPWGGSPPRPLCQKICYQTAQKTALSAPCDHPGGPALRQSTTNSGHRPLPLLRRGLAWDLA